MEICELSSSIYLYLFSDYYLILTHNLFYQEHNNITWDENFTSRIWNLGPYPQGEFHLKYLKSYPQGKFHLKDLGPYPQGFETLSTRI